MIQQMYPTVQHNYAYELNKDMHFAAAHHVPHPSAGICQQVHGHTYFCNLTIAGDTLDEAGFLIDFKTLKEIVHNRFDHQVLNHVLSIRMPTTEAVAQEIWYSVQKHLNTLPNQVKCLQVFLRETPTSYVIYRPKGAHIGV